MLHQVFDNDDLNETTILFLHCNVFCQCSMWLKQHCLYCIQGLQYGILKAAHKGDLDKVKDLIGQGCPVSTTDKVKFALAQIHHRTYVHSMFPLNIRT